MIGRVQDALEQMGELDAHRLRRALRQRERNSRRLEQTSHAGFLADHPGHPLGRGMPLGRPFRMDESHRDGWMRVLRYDPCAYCGAEGGTIDHIEPQAPTVAIKGIEIQPELGWGWQGGKHSWLNYTGCCTSCNNSKSDVPLLELLARRRGVFFPKRKMAA